MNRGLFDSHFSNVAAHYDGVRFTDPEPVSYIQGWLRKALEINGIELGCGTGRYTAKLLATLGKKLRLHCVDANAEMLAQLRGRINNSRQRRYTLVRGAAEEVQFAPGSCDAVFSFNALHHFNLPLTLRNISHWLRSRGLAFLYTRTPTQNKRTLWGRYFPDFARKEKRLKSSAVLRSAVDATPGIETVEVKCFAFSRSASLKNLLNKVHSYHYSTFRMYGRLELGAACETFARRLKEDFPDTDDIHWTDYNLMLTIEKEEEKS